IVADVVSRKLRRVPRKGARKTRRIPSLGNDPPAPQHAGVRLTRNFLIRLASPSIRSSLRYRTAHASLLPRVGRRFTSAVRRQKAVFVSKSERIPKIFRRKPPQVR